VRRSQSQLVSTFFGLTINSASISRLNLFKQIHEIVFHGKGGYDWETIYNMPIWLRKFTFSEISEFYKAENESYKKSTNSNTSSLMDSSGKINSPEFMKNVTEIKSTKLCYKSVKKMTLFNIYNKTTPPWLKILTS
jgi:hypothetical protein